jgi:signal transduction histidine kinase
VPDVSRPMQDCPLARPNCRPRVILSAYGLRIAADGKQPGLGDNGRMSKAATVPAPRKPRQLLAFALSAKPRAVLSRRAVIYDILFAALVTAASLAAVGLTYRGGIPLALATSVPLAARRRFPMTVFLVVLVAALITKSHTTDVTVLAIVIGGYSAAVHNRFRVVALLTLIPAGLAVAAVFWTARPTLPFYVVNVIFGGRFVGALSGPTRPTRPPGLAGLAGLVDLQSAGDGPLRFAGLLVLASLASIAIFGAVVYAGDRIRRLQSEHEAATRRALRLERTRIASELHDVVTHNVSVMIVQAGAARQVLGESPDDARAALLAVEASGRAAMAELRHLLDLLSPPGALASGAEAEGAMAEADLTPQPGLEQLRPLIDRVAAAGLPVELQVSGELHDLPPGLDLAAFRVVQEALTNVIKHAGQARTNVRLDRSDTDLVVDVADAGRPAPAGRQVPAPPAVPSGGGRGLIGLRERIELYGGELDAAPRPGGGWRVRAHFPVEPLSVSLGYLASTASAGRQP